MRIRLQTNRTRVQSPDHDRANKFVSDFLVRRCTRREVLRKIDGHLRNDPNKTGINTGLMRAMYMCTFPALGAPCSIYWFPNAEAIARVITMCVY
jgi:hypothetical protein